MGSPERVAVTHIVQTVLGNPANQIFRHWLVVGNLQEVFCCLVILQFLAKCFQRRCCWREIAVRLMRGKSEQEARLHEERSSPLDRLPGLWRDTLEDRVQAAQMW